MKRFLVAALVATWFLVALVLTVSRALEQDEFSDEQLFLGGAGLMASSGWLIYRDFFYNHMPTHALLLAGIFRLTSYWLLAARLLDATCGAILAVLVAEATRRAARGLMPRATQVAIATLVGAMFLANPITAEVVGKAWNHNLAAMTCVLGYGLLVRGLSGGGARPAAGWLVASGACAGIAATSRLTYAPTLVGFAVLLLIAPGLGRRDRARASIFWWIGALVASAPAIYVIASAPAAAYFGNVKFPAYSAMDRLRSSTPDRLLLSTKFSYAWDAISSSAALLILLVLTVVAIAVALRPYRLTLRRAAFAGLVAMLVAAAVSAFAPTPMYRQYLYGPVPFAAIAIGWALPHARIGRRAWPATVAFIMVACAGIGAGLSKYQSVKVYTVRPDRWTPMVRHADAEWITALAGPHARVLTLAPGTALEGGHQIYRKLSIGRYGVRVGELLSRRQRKELLLPTMAEIDGWFDSSPPDIVLLVELQTEREQALAAMAIKHGYWRKYFGPNKRAYLPPSRDPTTVPARPNSRASGDE